MCEITAPFCSLILPHMILPQRSWWTWPFQSSCSFRSPLTPTTAQISFSSQAAVSTQMKTWISLCDNVPPRFTNKDSFRQVSVFLRSGNRAQIWTFSFLLFFHPKGHYLLKLRETENLLPDPRRFPQWDRPFNVTISVLNTWLCGLLVITEIN